MSEILQERMDQAFLDDMKVKFHDTRLTKNFCLSAEEFERLINLSQRFVNAVVAGKELKEKREQAYFQALCESGAQFHEV